MRRTLLSALIASAFVSCSDQTTVYSDPQNDIMLEENQATLEKSIVYDYSGVLDITEDSQITRKTGGSAKLDIAGDYPLTLVAQVNPPSYDGAKNLTASHVDVDGDYAYVSYNTVEDGYAGGIDIIDVSNPNKPRITSRLYYINADINSLKYENGYVYAVGGVDSEKSVTATANSFIARILVSNGRFDTNAGITYGFQLGFNATDVATTPSKVLVTSGVDGLLTVYDKGTIVAQSEAPYRDLRSVAYNNNTIAILDASKGVSLLDLNLKSILEIPINSDFGANSKRSLDFYGDKIIVPEGPKGAGIYSATTGSLLEYVPIMSNPNGVAAGDIVTNAVAINDKVMLMANGGGGLCLTEDKGDNTSLVGIIELEGSINYVESKDDYIFAASGKKGLQIIKLNRPNQSLVERCASLEEYKGSANLEVANGANEAYNGSKRFNTITVDGSLLLCGSWTVSNAVDINTNALFEMNGTFVVGRNSKRKNVTVGANATFRVEGNLTIYGDLVLEDGATLEFLGNGSVVNVFGSVKKSGTVEVKGTFLDFQNKF